MEWASINKKEISTFPPEGVEVLVSDGYKMSVAWYLMSSEYTWMKSIIEEDDVVQFSEFNVKKWRYIGK